MHSAGPTATWAEKNWNDAIYLYEIPSKIFTEAHFMKMDFFILQ